MNFAHQVHARYHVEEVDAGVKEFLKKAAKLLAGTLLISQTAFGFHIKNPKSVNVVLEDMLEEVAAQDAGNKSNYTVTVVEQHKGKLQAVEWKILKDGKVAAEVKFVGTDNDAIDQVKAGTTAVGKNDDAVNETVKLLTDFLQHKMSMVRDEPNW